MFSSSTFAKTCERTISSTVRLIEAVETTILTPQCLSTLFWVRWFISTKVGIVLGLGLFAVNARRHAGAVHFRPVGYWRCATIVRKMGTTPTPSPLRARRTWKTPQTAAGPLTLYKIDDDQVFSLSQTWISPLTS